METDDNQGDEAAGWGDVSIDGVPDRIAAALEDQDLGSAACRVCVKSRLMRNGQYGESWLAIGPALGVTSCPGRSTDAASKSPDACAGISMFSSLE